MNAPLPNETMPVLPQKIASATTAETARELAREKGFEADLDAALEICSRGGRQSKDDRFAHLAASIHAVRGDIDKAAKFLELAIQLNPRNRVLAFHDPDFEALREEPEHADLFAATE